MPVDSSKFNVSETSLSGVYVIERKPLGDARGYLERLYCQDDLSALLGDRHIAQINHTLTERKGTIRGMHYQHPPHAETKIVSCVKGRIFDVAVDLRKDSETYLKWFGVELSGDNFRTLYIPEGFAHGFQTLEDECELIYFHSHSYTPDAEAAVDAMDPGLNIDWPLDAVLRSERDMSHPKIDNTFRGIEL